MVAVEKKKACRKRLFVRIVNSVDAERNTPYEEVMEQAGVF